MSSGIAPFDRCFRHCITRFRKVYGGSPGRIERNPVAPYAIVEM
jgi:hypothetical protein